MKKLVKVALTATFLVVSSSLVGCGSQTLTCNTNSSRTIEITDGDKTYDANDIIDGFENGEATATWVYYASSQSRYYKYETEDAHTTSNFLNWSCTSYRYRITAVNGWTDGSLSASGIVNYSGEDSISRIYYTKAGENYY